MTTNRAVRRLGFSLIEVMTVCIIMGVLASFTVPRFSRAMEQSRANIAVANLRAIWSAQRLYWLQNRTYAPDLNTLLSANLIDPSLPGATIPYTYSIADASDNWFTATATRGGSSSWSGGFTIAADGTFTGTVQQAGGVSLEPGFQ